MSIYYNIVTKDRKRSPTRYACFGLLNQLNSHHQGNIYRGSRFYNEDLFDAGIIHASINRDAANVIAIEFDYDASLREDHYQSTINRVVPIYISYIQNLIKEFATFRECVSIRPDKKVIRVTTVNQPCDKVLFCLSVIRNTMRWVAKYHTPRYNETALGLVEEKIPDFKKRMIFLWIFDIYKNGPFGDNPNSLGVKPAFSSEYSLLNPATFGFHSLQQLYYNDANIEWFQPLFQESVSGYKRDHHFASNNTPFPGAAIDVFRGRYHNTNARSYEEDEYPRTALIGGYLYRRLFDSLSIPGDEPLFDFCTWNEKVGFMWQTHNTENYTFDTEILIEQYLNLFEEN